MKSFSSRNPKGFTYVDVYSPPDKGRGMIMRGRRVSETKIGGTDRGWVSLGIPGPAHSCEEIIMDLLLCFGGSSPK